MTTVEIGNDKLRFQKIALAITIILASCQASTAGFQLNSQSATGLGRAFAGDAIIADNASVMARNAAAMALFDKTSLSLGVSINKSKIEVTDASYQQGATYNTTSNYDDAGNIAYVPNFHLIMPINDKITVGVDLYSNFATKTEFDNSFKGAEYGGVTDLASVNLGIAASYRLNQQWSVAAGLDIIYGQGKLQRNLNAYHPVTGGIIETKTGLDVDVAGADLGFNVGTVFELDKNNRFGISYHYSPELEAKGDVTFLREGDVTPVTATDDTLYMQLPDMAEFSGYHRIPDSKFAVHYSVQWIGWSVFNTLDSKAHGTLNDYQWKDTLHFSIGGTYYLSPVWTLRTGYMYDQGAQNEITSISVPDSDRQWFSAGFTYHISDKSNVDFGATYVLGKEVQVNETSTVSSINATSSAQALLTSMQYSYTF